MSPWERRLEADPEERDRESKKESLRAAMSKENNNSPKALSCVPIPMSCTGSSVSGIKSHSEWGERQALLFLTLKSLNKWPMRLL